VVCVRRLLLSPRWLVRTLIALAWVGTCLWLGWWQWGRAQLTSSPQNLGYALQWPLFALFAAFAWWRMLRLELNPPVTPAPAPEGSPSAVATATATNVPLPGDPAVDGEPDDELAAYNRYLRALHVQDQRRLQDQRRGR